MKNFTNDNFNNDLCRFGIGLFETFKIDKNGIALDLQEHLNRMFESIKTLQLDFELDYNFLKDETTKYLAKNNLKNIVLRVTVFKEGYFFTTREIAYTKRNYENGYKLLIASHKRGANILYKHKTCNYFENIYYNHCAKKLGFDDILFIDYDNNILETSFCNIFFIANETIYTPAESLYLLNGILRQKVIDICRKNKIEIKITMIKLEEIGKFDFCFITNSVMNILKVTQIGDIKYKKTSNTYEKLLRFLPNF